MSDPQPPAMAPELREVRRQAVFLCESYGARHVSTHYEGCWDHHIECFARDVLQAIDAEEQICEGVYDDAE